MSWWCWVLLVATLCVAKVIWMRGIDARECRQMLRLLANWTNDVSWEDIKLPHDYIWGDVYYLEEINGETVPMKLSLQSFEEALLCEHAIYPPFWIVHLKGITPDEAHPEYLICSRYPRRKYALKCSDRYDKGNFSEARIVMPDGATHAIQLHSDDKPLELYLQILQFVSDEELRRAFGGQQLQEL